MDKRVKTAALATLLAAAPVFGLNCSGGIVESQVFVLLISMTWLDAHDPDHTVRFVSEDDGKENGSFTGEDKLAGRANIPISGNWEKNKITLNVLSHSPKTYTAEFSGNNPTRLEFDGPASFVLIQDPNR